MKRLVAITVILAGLWSGYWFYASGQKKAAIENWFVAKQQDGWEASYSDLSVAGFPNRVDTTLDEVTLANQEGTVKWSAPFFQLLSLVYNPSHVIAIWPESQIVQTPFVHATLRHEDLRASVVLDSDDSDILNRLSLVGKGIEAKSDRGSWTAQDFKFAAEREAGAISDYKIAVSADQMSLKLPLVGGITLPDRFETLALDTRMTFAEPLNASTASIAPPAPSKVEIVSADIHWASLQVAANGTLEFDDQGVPAGALDFKLQNWDQMISDIANSGAISHAQAQSTRMMVGMLAASSGDPREFDGTLTFVDGMMKIGQLSLGPAPSLSLR